MADAKSPRVSVKVGVITIQPGEVLTVMVAGRDSVMTQIEIRSVGVPGSNVGRVEVFCDDEFLLYNFSEWKTMNEAVQRRVLHERLTSPVPAEKGEE